MRSLSASKAVAIGVLLFSPILSHGQKMPSPESAEFSSGFGLDSLVGDYAVVNHYGANLALGIGTEHFDGNGKLRGTLLLNRPTATGTRDLLPLTSTGTYTVNEDGTGTIVLTVTLPDGTIKTATEDFVITNTL